MKKLTKELAIECVAKIDKIKYDDEMAHIEEDDLREWFIRCCSEGMYTKNEMIEIAKIVISTEYIPFARWCA